ncbi:hypothetical protein PS6_002043 [Mucor atramentarius]
MNQQRSTRIASISKKEGNGNGTTKSEQPSPVKKTDEFLVKFENEKDDRHNTKALSLEEIISLGVGISERDDSADVKAKQQENAKFDIAALQKNQGT